MSQHNPDFDFLHSEPRYQALLKAMGLPPAFLREACPDAVAWSGEGYPDITCVPFRTHLGGTIFVGDSRGVDLILDTPRL